MPSDPRLRASDEDRDRAATLLREHLAAGRLTPAEFDERLSQVFSAVTIGDLEALTEDMPGVDLYQLPAAGIYPRGGGPRLVRQPSGSITPYTAPAWLIWAGSSGALAVAWLIVGAVEGGAAWIPWFLLIVIPWALGIARRQ